MMRKGLLAVTMLCTLSLFGCKKQVPTNIVQRSLKNALRHAPLTASGMCGATVKGLPNATITIAKRGANNTGVAHVVGAPWMAPGAPSKCEGDVEFAYSYNTKRTGYRGRNKTTTWYLDHLKLVAVQTPGVAFKAVDESNVDDDDD
ncbi:MAG: hypothetical protein KC657_28430 [Myxococcales bacterium]|nr:hypothetical protein [Myxococcales bacterium]